MAPCGEGRHELCLCVLPSRPIGRTSMGDALSGSRVRLSGAAPLTVSTRSLDTAGGLRDAPALPRGPGMPVAPAHSPPPTSGITAGATLNPDAFRPELWARKAFLFRRPRSPCGWPRARVRPAVGPAPDGFCPSYALLCSVTRCSSTCFCGAIRPGTVCGVCRRPEGGPPC
jgi:hypothetical protein